MSYSCDAMMLLLLLIASMTGPALAQNTYLIASPSTIRANMDMALAVNILQAQRNVTVSAVVVATDSSGTAETARGSGQFQAGNPGTLLIRLPPTLKNARYFLRVTGTGGLSFSGSANLRLNNKEISVFIQTDKGIYKPSDTVNLRTFAVYPDLRAYTGKMNLTVTDGAKNKIRQWLQESPIKGVITKSIVLSSQPVFGEWKLEVKTEKATGQKIFTVSEYVLPKFEVKLLLPAYILTSDSSVVLTVNSSYTYGKPVTGKVKGQFKLIDITNTSYIGLDVSVEILIFGKADITVSLSEILSRVQNPHNLRLFVSANVTETLTNISIANNETLKIYTERVNVEFPSLNPSFFKPGLSHTAYLRLSQPDGLPVRPSTEKVKVDTRIISPGQVTDLPTRNLNVPSNGLLSIQVSPPFTATFITIMANYRGIVKQLYLQKSLSQTGTYLQLSGIQSGQKLICQATSTEILKNLTYQIISRGTIVKVGQIVTKGQNSQSFEIMLDSSMSPSARIVVYYISNTGEVIADGISFDVAGIFKNKVSLDFNITEAEPGDPINLTVRADPQSAAYIMALDQSVLFLKSGNDITSKDIYNEIKTYDSYAKSTNNFVPANAVGWPYPIYYDGKDPKIMFENTGLQLVTDATVYDHLRPTPVIRPQMTGTAEPETLRTPHVRENWLIAFQRPEHQSNFIGVGLTLVSKQPSLSELPSQGEENRPQAELQEAVHVRYQFPEAWIWEQLDVSSNGSASIVTTAPHTITSWVAGAFAINSDSGLGVATTTQMTVFRPFFVNLNLPYSIVRGEQLAVHAIIFNYMQEDMMVKVTLKRSQDFRIIEHRGEEPVFKDAFKNIMVKKGQAENAFFAIIPIDIGNIEIEVMAQSTIAADAIRRQLLVKPEGVPKEVTFPVYIDMGATQAEFSKLINLSLPNNTVSGSELVLITAFGDIMGPTIAGLDLLLSMPVGCGEQNMIRMAPDVYIMYYLMSVNQITEEIRAKAVGFMETGYQKELTYKHVDGSFSIWGQSDTFGSMWLTAFVARVFRQARPFIFVDDGVIESAVNWIINKQNWDGSFPEPGRVIDNKMQSLSVRGPALTAFVVIAMLENRNLFNEQGIQSTTRFIMATNKSVAYLEREALVTDNLYVLILSCYALQLANSSRTQEILNKIELRATIRDGLKYWEYTQSSVPNQPIAINTELAGYMLLVYALRRDLLNGKSVMQWIAMQRNSNGGFSSTQDTVVALNALSEFARLVYVETNLQVTCQLNISTSFVFAVNSANSLILQMRETKTVPQNITIKAQGTGVAIITIAVIFNIRPHPQAVTFSLNVTLIEEGIDYMKVKTCTWWLIDGQHSGMAVEEIEAPSGFDIEMDSISQNSLLRRIDPEADGKIALYFDKVETTPLCISYKASRSQLVGKSAPAAVTVFDYYAPLNRITVMYQPTILFEMDIMDLCHDC